MSAETENSASRAVNLEKCAVVLLDVAGTTTSISFVKETLFPHVIEKAADFLKSHWEDKVVKESVKLLKDSEIALEDAVAAVKEQTKQNSDNEGLKKLQGLIYKQGYEKGDLKAHIFTDVLPSINAWAKTKKIAIYSTGSIESQKLLFTHTTEGDISSNITKYYDQDVGSKTVSESYEKIAKDLDIKTEEIVFITDNAEEAKAAKKSGAEAILVKREGNEALPDEAAKEFTVITTFKEVTFENPAKRKNKDEAVPTEEQPPSKVAKTEVAKESVETETVAEAPVTETPAVEIKADDKVESMEVDAPEEKEPTTSEEKPEVPEPEKTDAAVSNEKEIKDKVNNEEKETESKSEIEAEETPMETSDDVETKKAETEEKQKVEDNREETVTEDAKEKPKELKDDETKKTNGLTEVDETKTVEVVKDAVVSNTADAEMVDVVEKEVATKVEVKPIENVEEKTVDKVDKSEGTEPTKEEIKIVKETESKPREVEKETVSCDKSKVVAEEKDEKVEETAEVMEKAEVEEKKESVADEKTGNNLAEETKKLSECSSADDGTKEIAKPTECSSADSKSKKMTLEPEAKKEADAPSEPKEETANEPATEQASKDEKTEEGKSSEEKENKSDLANGIENGKTEPNEAVNGGGAEEKGSEGKSDAMGESITEDIKVKKVDDTDSTPPVSVEV